ncbi:MAG: RecX family transcriptional regulator [Candidatus Omnitrophica bacterium]|nr:RecX family transcriptional regulator [Candidatus Omnitrophota bacterium]
MNNFNKALNYSFLLLKYRARSTNEIVSRLKRRGYTPTVRQKVVDYLEENNYLNDEEFARLYVNCSLEKGWGPIRIDFNLMKLGISEALCKQVLEGDFACNSRIREIIEEKLEYYKRTKPSLPEPKIWQKIVLHLGRKGFDYKVINQEIENLGVNRFEDK